MAPARFFLFIFDSGGMIFKYKVWFIITFLKNSLLLSKNVFQ
jgi:hypothetical protein